MQYYILVTNNRAVKAEDLTNKIGPFSSREKAVNDIPKNLPHYLECDILEYPDDYSDPNAIKP